MATIVFDGNDTSPSIEENIHKRRQQNIHNAIIYFTDCNKFEGKQEEYIKMERMKQKIIKLIRKEMPYGFFKWKVTLTRKL